MRHEEHFFEIILNLDKWFKRRGHLKIFLIYSSGDLFHSLGSSVLPNHCAIMVVGILQNISIWNGGSRGRGNADFI